LRLFSFGGYGLALVALALVVFGAIECINFSKIHDGGFVVSVEIHQAFRRCFTSDPLLAATKWYY